jgi:hypothetical protein
MSQVKSDLSEVGINLEQHSLGENEGLAHEPDVLTGNFWPMEVPESGSFAGFWGAEIVFRSADRVKILPSHLSAEEGLFDAVVISRLSHLRSIELISGKVLRPRYEHFRSRHLRVLVRERPPSPVVSFPRNLKAHSTDGDFPRSMTEYLSEEWRENLRPKPKSS